MNRKVCEIVISVTLAALAIPALAAPEIIPCAVGNKWDYDVVKVLRASITYQGQPMATLDDASSGSSTYSVTSTEASAGAPVFDYSEATDLSSNSGNSESDKLDMRISPDKAGLKILNSVREVAEDKPDTQSYDPPLLYYPADAAPGKSWNVGVMRDGDTKSVLNAKITGKETITVPAGTFKDCLKVIYISDDISGTMDMWGKTFTLTNGKSRGIYWVADGVGVVKELEISTSSAEAQGPDGKPITISGAVCTVSELRPGFIVKK